MEGEKSGLSSPAGVVFSSRANLFHVIESRGNKDILSGDLVIKNISVFGHDAGTTRIRIGIEDLINMTMDNKFGRLLIYQTTTHQLIEVNEDSSGNLDPNTLAIHEVSSFGLQEPQGMTFDSIQGYLYFLDAVGPQLIQIKLQTDGSFLDSTIDTLNLSWASNLGLRGITFDPNSGNFHVVSPGEQRLYEFTYSGEVVAIRDLSEFNLSNPQSIVFAPSADQTDDPMELSLYLADSGFPTNSGTNLFSGDISTTARSQGKIVELSLVQPLGQINADFTSDWVKTTNTAAFSPPSPDPAGLTYVSSSNTILISDPDVEETKGGITHFDGVNLWWVTLGGNVVNTANISLIPPTKTPMTDEPTGAAWNPGNGHYYFSDDHGYGVWDLNPGIDGQVGTADDSWTSFSTIAENGDPEGIAYDNWHDRLFVSDGVNREVYQYTMEGTLVGQFDVEVHGLTDPEGIEFNPLSGTLFVLGNGTTHAIIETTTSGSLLQTIDISDSPIINPAGLAYAPASDGSGPSHFYIVDRGIDNDIDPNENDGKMYEMTAPVPSTPTNTPPVVNAGLNQTISFGNNATLTGSATDDGHPNPSVTTIWSKTSGPGNVTFGNPNVLTTTASFSATGTYALRLTAYDGEFYSYDEINVNVTSVAGSSILEVRVAASSDDAEESNSTGAVDLVSPDLELVYDAGQQTVGMRFNWVSIPKNAQINDAYIQFQVDEVESTATSLTVKGEAQDNPGTFTIDSQNISLRLRTTASVGWSPQPWTTEGQAGVAQRTSNISSIIQEIVDRSGWSAGNSMVIIIEGTGGFNRRIAEAYDGDRSGAPRLHIEYTSAIPPNNTTTVNCGSGNPVVTYGSSITCVATVTRNSPGNTPSGTVSWTTSGSGSFVTSPCTLPGGGGASKSCSVTYTPNARGSGSHLITATYSGDSNFTVSSGSQTVTVNQRPITVTADAKTKVYGQADPALTYQITSGSLVIGDAFTGALTRVAGENVNTYAIQKGTLALSDNYTLTYVGANLSITPRLITVTADAKTKVYGQADPALTYQITSGSLAFSDAFSGALTRVVGENVSAYAIQKGSLALSANYTLTYVGANLTITPRPITVKADAKSKIYGQADPALTYQITSGSLAFSDAFTGALTRVAGESVGKYAILQGSLALTANYTLTYIGADLTISDKLIYLPIITR
jgi:hypothetical protein